MLAPCDMNLSALCICIQNNCHGAVRDDILAGYRSHIAHGEVPLNLCPSSPVSTHQEKPEGKLQLSFQWHQNLGSMSHGWTWLLGMKMAIGFAPVLPDSGRLGCARHCFGCLHSDSMIEQWNLLDFSGFLLSGVL